MKEYLFDEGETFVIDGTEFGGFDPKIAVFNPKFLSKEKNDELIEKDINLMPVSFIESEDIYFFQNYDNAADFYHKFKRLSEFRPWEDLREFIEQLLYK